MTCCNKKRSIKVDSFFIFCIGIQYQLHHSLNTSTSKAIKISGYLQKNHDYHFNMLYNNGRGSNHTNTLHCALLCISNFQNTALYHNTLTFITQENYSIKVSPTWLITNALNHGIIENMKQVQSVYKFWWWAQRHLISSFWLTVSDFFICWLWIIFLGNL